MRTIVFFMFIMYSYIWSYGQAEDKFGTNTIQIGYSYKNIEQIYVTQDTIIKNPFSINSYSFSFSKRYTKSLDYSFGYIYGPLHYIFLEQKIHIMPLLFNKESRIDFYIPFGFDFWFYKDYENRRRIGLDAFHYGFGTSALLSKNIACVLEVKKMNSNKYNYKPYIEIGFSYNWLKSKNGK